MPQRRRIASAHPPVGFATRFDHDRRVGTRARELVRELQAGFKRNDLLTYSSAISFQILTAIIPFLLFVLAVAGLVHLQGVWQNHLEPQIRSHVSTAVFQVISTAVTNVFASRRVFWVTFGGALALWQVSGAVRAVMGALAGIYGATSERSFLRRYLVSFTLSIVVGACLIGATVCVLLAPFIEMKHPGALWEVFAFLVRWVPTLGLLLLSVGLLVRYAPAREQPLPWVSFGAGIVVSSWIVVSLGFYVYLTDVASYSSVFGSLASVIVLMGYLYMSTTAFLFGTQLDAIVRTQAAGAASGSETAPVRPGR